MHVPLATECILIQVVFKPEAMLRQHQSTKADKNNVATANLKSASCCDERVCSAAVNCILSGWCTCLLLLGDQGTEAALSPWRPEQSPATTHCVLSLFNLSCVKLGFFLLVQPVPT